jgi:hypothetical protein
LTESKETIDSNINPRYLDALHKFSKTEIENANKAADYWYLDKGDNVIPVDSIIKKAWILKTWKQYQSNSIPPEVFERWKELGLFTYGIGVVLGRIWRGKNRDQYRSQIDADNERAIQEICTITTPNRGSKTFTIEEFAERVLTEQHKDNLSRAHFYILSNKPFPIKASDKGNTDTGNMIDANKVPGIEVKSVGICLEFYAYEWMSL